MAQFIPKMTQQALFPFNLEQLVRDLHYKDGWNFRLSANDYNRGQGSNGLTLVIQLRTYNSYPPHQPMVVNHLFPVPPAAYDDRSWQRWLLDQILLVEQHEACEFFQIGDEHPYAPSHGPGNNPYLIREIGTETDKRTSFTGEINDH